MAVLSLPHPLLCAWGCPWLLRTPILWPWKCLPLLPTPAGSGFHCVLVRPRCYSGCSSLSGQPRI